MKPTRTEVAAEPGGVVPLAELKTYCRVYGPDTEEDAALTALEAAAVDKIAARIGRPLGAVAVTDFYRGWSRRLELSQPGAVTAVNVAVRPAGGGVQAVLLTPLTPQVPGAWRLDETADPRAVVIPVAPDVALDRDAEAPVSVSYTTAALAGAGTERVMTAIKLLVNEMYHHGGDGGLAAKGLSPSIERLIAAWTPAQRS